MTLTIKKASIKKGLFLNVEYTESDEDIRNDVKKECNQVVHSDMVEAFNSLKPHLAMLCEMIDESLVNSLDDIDMFASTLEKLQITGFTIGGSDEHEGVCIVGQRKLKGGRILNLVTPFMKFEDDKEPYTFMWDLQNCITICIDEVQQYLNGKQAPKTQLELFENENDEGQF